MKRGYDAVSWIEKYCVVPHGPGKGQPVKLTPEQVAIVLGYVNEQRADEVSGPLAAYLTLMHICGPFAVRHNVFSPHFRSDVFTTWTAAGPDLRAFLTRKGDKILCPELGTSYEAA
jgi:hypothetical protein